MSPFATGKPTQQHLRRHSLQHHARGLIRADRLGQLHNAVGLDEPRLGIAADRPAIGNPVAELDMADTLADRFDQARALDARREGQLLRIKTGAVIDVDEVEAAASWRSLTWPGRVADLDLLPPEDLGAAT